MKVDPVRGVKFGLGNAALFPVIMAVNQYFRSEEIVPGSLLTGAAFAFVFFGTIGTLTDKIGSEIGE